MATRQANRKRPFVMVRIKTYNKGRGHVARRFTYQGKRFDIDHGWYKVGRGMGAELGKIRHPSTDAEVFDIVELEAAQELVEAEAHEPWAAGQLAPERAGEVRVSEFKRRDEIKKERASQDESTDEGWDDESPERSDSRATEPPQPKAAPPAAKKKATSKKKKVTRRSQTK